MGHPYNIFPLHLPYLLGVRSFRGLPRPAGGVFLLGACTYTGHVPLIGGGGVKHQTRAAPKPSLEKSPQLHDEPSATFNRSHPPRPGPKDFQGVRSSERLGSGSRIGWPFVVCAQCLRPATGHLRLEPNDSEGVRPHSNRNMPRVFNFQNSPLNSIFLPSHIFTHSWVANNVTPSLRIPSQAFA